MMNTKQKILISIAWITLVWLTTISAFASNSWNTWSSMNDKSKQSIQRSITKWTQSEGNKARGKQMRDKSWSGRTLPQWQSGSLNKEHGKWMWMMGSGMMMKMWEWMKNNEMQYLKTDLTKVQKDAIKVILDTHKKSVMTALSNTGNTVDAVKSFLIGDLTTLQSDLLQYVATDKVDAYNKTFTDRIAKINSATTLWMLSPKMWMDDDKKMGKGRGMDMSKMTGQFPPFIKKDLTDTQKAAVKAILASHKVEMDAIHNGTGSENVKQLSHEAVMIKLQSELAPYIDTTFDMTKMPMHK